MRHPTFPFIFDSLWLQAFLVGFVGARLETSMSDPGDSPLPAEQAPPMQAPEQAHTAQAAEPPPMQMPWPSDAQGLAAWLRSHGLTADVGRARLHVCM